MSDRAARTLLLVEPETLLRRTVSLTARTLGLGNVHEAASLAEARRLLRDQAFDGAMIAIDCETCASTPYDLGLLDLVRLGHSASAPTIPIAVLADSATAPMLHELRERDVKRVILKPFRARVLLDAFAEFDGSGA
ncbi:response regulator [Rugamonas apoptosis]|uniref:Response regulator n=1 Tax=Rugamonas apoptosis TaxID=2758570 RepID=A0A7W2ILU7_9BURK|nr:response regulator [Rugamonas apoptosis]MBA5689190.1 response regulator [Rugamonas apoptosis]